MSVDRIWRWVCDQCGAVREVEGWGVPSGWIFVKGPRITHACQDCRESIPRDRRGVPVVTADK